MSFRNGSYVNKMKERKGNKTKIQYVRISAGPQRGEYVHRMIVAARIGRNLNDWETVDHRDGNTLNNHPSNLSDPISYAEHAELTNARQKAKHEEKLKKEERKKAKRRASPDFAFGANA